MNSKPGSSAKAKTTIMESVVPHRKLRLNNARADVMSTGRRRATSVSSNSSSISGKTVITRQTIRTEINKRKEVKRIEDFLSDAKGINFIEELNLKREVIKESSVNFRKKSRPTEDMKYHNESNLESISEVSEDVNKFLDHLKQTWFYFFLMTFKLVKAVLNCVFSLFYILMSFIMRALVVLTQVVVLVMLMVYFLISYFLPDKSSTPFVNAIKYETISILDFVDHNNRVLYLDLDNTLVYCTKTKPKTAGYTKILVKSVDTGESVVYYLHKRPHLEEFLREVV